MRHDLPAFAARVSEVIGQRLALALMAHIHGTGGTGWIRVPRRAKPGHKLVEIIGHAAAEKLCGEFGGRVIRLPRCDAIHRTKRNAEIRRMADEGVPVREIAQAFALTDRHVRNVLSQQGTAGA